jgi:hypothetical protein
VGESVRVCFQGLLMLLEYLRALGSLGLSAGGYINGKAYAGKDYKVSDGWRWGLLS